jgi:phage repressor protein C with HTH and peptisase S24 domain
MKSIERVFQYLDYKGLKHTRAEKDWGLSNGYLGAQLKRKSDLGEGVIKKIIDNCLDMSLEWLLFGNGDMIKREYQASPTFPIEYDDLIREAIEQDEEYRRRQLENKNITFPSSEIPDVDLSSRPNSRPNSKTANLGLHNSRKPTDIRTDGKGGFERAVESKASEANEMPTVSIPLLEISAAATPGAGYLAPDYIEQIGTIQLPQSMVKRGKQHFAFSVINESMTPTLFRNDIVIIYESDIYSIIDDYVYVIVTRNDGIIIKRIKNRIEERGFIRCKSDNKAYSSYNLLPDDVLMVYQVICKMSFNMGNQAADIYEMISRLEDKIEDMQAHMKPQKGV